MVKFLVDESSGKAVHTFLLEKGFDVKFVTELMPGVSDEKVLMYAEREERILITNDKDFGELIFRLNKPSSGVILLRLKTDVPGKRVIVLSRLLKDLSHKLSSHFIVATEGKVRIKRL